uniref:Uncharacterized protein n=1 Tax=Candidozyma auris TaxID=498019 RepID=A0A0L0NQW5_CANAR
MVKLTWTVLLKRLVLQEALALVPVRLLVLVQVLLPALVLVHLALVPLARVVGAVLLDPALLLLLVTSLRGQKSAFQTQLITNRIQVPLVENRSNDFSLLRCILFSTTEPMSSISVFSKWVKVPMAKSIKLKTLLQASSLP